MAKVFRVTYLDGSEPDDVTTGVRAAIEVERRWPGRQPDRTDTAPYLEGVLYGVWSAMGSPGEFEDFLARVDDVEPLADPEAVPSEPAPGDAS